MRGEQRGDRAVFRRHHRERFHITRIRETKAAVFGGNLDAEGSDIAELLHVFFGNLAGAIDHVGVDAPKEIRELIEKRLRAFGFAGIFGWVWMDQIQSEAAQEHFADETWTRPLTLARRFGNVTGFLLGSKSTGMLGHGFVYSLMGGP